MTHESIDGRRWCHAKAGNHGWKLDCGSRHDYMCCDHAMLEELLLKMGFCPSCTVGMAPHRNCIMR